MAGLSTPQQTAGITTFYDAPSKGPKLNPKLVLIAVVALAIIVLIFDHVITTSGI